MMQLEMHGKISENRGLVKTLHLLPISIIRSYSSFYKDRDMAIKWLALSLSLNIWDVFGSIPELVDVCPALNVSFFT